MNMFCSAVSLASLHYPEVQTWSCKAANRSGNWLNNKTKQSKLHLIQTFYRAQEFCRCAGIIYLTSFTCFFYGLDPSLPELTQRQFRGFPLGDPTCFQLGSKVSGELRCADDFLSADCRPLLGHLATSLEESLLQTWHFLQLHDLICPIGILCVHWWLTVDQGTRHAMTSMSSIVGCHQKWHQRSVEQPLYDDPTQINSVLCKFTETMNWIMACCATLDKTKMTLLYAMDDAHVHSLKHIRSESKGTLVLLVCVCSNP